MFRLPLALTILLGFCAGAHAADQGTARPPLAPPVLAEDFSSGWYMRGDAIASIYRSPTVTFGVPPGSFRLNEPRIATGYGGGLGIGFKYQWFRTDVTADYRFGAPLRATAPASLERARFSAGTLMLNGYVDLIPTGAITPYVGAGVGGAFETVESWAATPGVARPRLNGTRSAFAYAAMAGVAVDLTPSLKLDVGYRYLALTGMRFNDPGLPAGGVARLGALGAHEIRVGLRYMFQ